MSETIEVEISDPHAKMLESLESQFGPGVHKDLARVLEQNIHDSYQAAQSP